MAAVSFFEGLQSSIFDKTIVPVTLEMMRLFPDGLVIASGLYALITLSYANGIFFGSMLEATVIFRFIQGFAAYTNMAGNMAPSSDAFSSTCKTGFSHPTATIGMMSMFGDDPLANPFPSAPIFMLSTAASYIFTSLNYQSKELEALGLSYSSRYYVSAMLLLILLGIFVAFRLTFNCDSFGLVMVTIPIGLILGPILVYQNSRLFGPTSINMLGIPLLRNRTADGKKLYVCPK
jgi:hypothetical protein